MYFSTVVTGLLAAGAASAAEMTVMIGEGGLKYSPDSITAAMGDTVRFVWASSTPHNVASSDVDQPCMPNNVVASPVMKQSDKMDFVVTVNSTDPMYMFCSVGDHCSEGMSMVINGPTMGDPSLASYMSAAKNAQASDPDGTNGGMLVAAGSSSGSSSSAMSGMSSMAPSSTMMMSGSMSGSMSATGSSMPMSSGATAMSSAGANAAPTAQAKAAFGAAAAGLLGFAAVL